jgi:NodT family efflux transporter outer membrane factor (OMF) lipoprotein
MTRTIAPITLLGLLALVSCAVGPDYHTPAPPPGPGYATPAALATASASAPVAGGEAQHLVQGLDIPGEWWTLFRSAELNALIEQALAHNPTLESAQAALRQARETALAARGALLPSLSAQFQGEREEISSTEFGLPNFPSTTLSLSTATVSTAYTLDVFGGVRRQVESAKAASEAQRYLLEASYLTLTSNLVTAAITEASLREQVDAVETLARDQQAVLDITRKRVDAGGASRADVLQQQSTLQATLATLPPLKTQLAQQRNLLATLVGALPADYQGPAFRLDSLSLPTELPLAIPSKLLEQRPDVQQYAAVLHEAAANIGVATANMLPQLTITGSYGSIATRASDLFSANSIIWNAIGSAAQPLFKGGQLLHQRRAAVAAAQQAAANYKATVLTAFQNVSDALYALSGDADALAANLAAERAAADSLALAEAQYKIGGTSYLQVLSAQQSYQNAVVGLVKARAQRFSDTAALFQALGGGWWNRKDSDGHPDNAIPAPSFGATHRPAPPADASLASNVQGQDLK